MEAVGMAVDRGAVAVVAAVRSMGVGEEAAAAGGWQRRRWRRGRR